jgi:hypothetical protein
MRPKYSVPSRENTLSQLVSGVVVSVLLAGILFAGLTPFHAPLNAVKWIPNADGIQIGNNGTLVSSGTYSLSPVGRTLEIVIEPQRLVGSGMIVAFYNPAAARFFSLSQQISDLELNTQSTNRWRFERATRLHLTNAFSRNKTAVWAVSADAASAAIYLDGKLAVRTTDFGVFPEEFSGRLIIGNSPIYNNNWTGLVRGIAVFDRALSAEEISRQYNKWQETGTHFDNSNDNCTALYLFDEGLGDVVHNRCGFSGDLYIPTRYVVIHPTVLDPVWQAFNWSKGFWQDALVNVVGFIPFGFFLREWLSGRGFRRSAFLAVVLGGAVSLFIELLQTQLPTRDSSMSDLITNVLGSACGAFLQGNRFAQNARSRLSGLLRNGKQQVHG